MGKSNNQNQKDNSSNNQNGNLSKENFSPKAAEKLPNPVNSRANETIKEDVKNNPIPFFKTLKNKNPFKSKNNNAKNNSENKNQEKKLNNNSNKKTSKFSRLKGKFTRLNTERQTEVILGFLLLIPMVFYIPGLIILIFLCSTYLLSGFTGKKFLLTQLLEKASWNDNLNEFQENNSNTNSNSQNNNSGNNSNNQNNSQNNSH